MHLLLDYRPALRDRTGVGEWVHQLALNLLHLKAAGDPAAAGLELTLWTSSWRDRPTPSALRELERRHLRRPQGACPAADLGLESPGLASHRGPDVSTLRRRALDDPSAAAGPFGAPGLHGLRPRFPGASGPHARRDAARLPETGARARGQSRPCGHDFGALEAADRGAAPRGPRQDCRVPARRAVLDRRAPAPAAGHRPGHSCLSARSSRARMFPSCWRRTGLSSNGSPRRRASSWRDS